MAQTINNAQLVAMTTEEYAATKHALAEGTLAILTDNVDAPLAANGQTIPSTSGGGGGGGDETYLTATDETATLPNSVNLGAIGTGKNFLVSDVTAGTSTLSPLAIPTTGILVGGASNTPSFTNTYSTGNQAFSISSGSASTNLTGATIGLNGTTSITGTLGVSSSLTANNGFSQVAGSHSITTGGSNYSLSAGAGTATIAAASLGITAPTTITGNGSVTGTFSVGSTLTANNGFAQNAGSHNVTSGNNPISMNAGTNTVSFTGSALNLNGNSTVTGNLNVSGNGSFGGISFTNLSVSGTADIGGAITAHGGFTLDNGAVDILTQDNNVSVNAGTGAMDLYGGVINLHNQVHAFSTLAVGGDATITGVTTLDNEVFCSSHFHQNGQFTALTGDQTFYVDTGVANTTYNTNQFSVNSPTIFFSGTVQSGGTAIFPNMSVSGGVFVGGNLTTNSAFTCNGLTSNSGSVSLFTTGQPINIDTAGGSISISGNTTFNNDVTTGNITITGSTVSLTNLPTSTGTTLVLDGSNNVALLTSSRRFKENIQSLDTDTSRIAQLNPVSFNYKSSGEKSFGYIAEEVVNIFPEVVVVKDEQPFSINYELLSVFAIEEIKKLSKRIEHLEEKLNK